MQADSPQHVKLEGLAQYIEAVNTVLGLASRTLRIFDSSLEGLGYNAPSRNDALRRFLLASRNARLRMVVHDTEHLARYCPRLLLLLREFSHAVEIRRTEPHARHVYDPFVIADDAHYVHRFHHEDTRSLLGLFDPAGAEDLNRRFEEIWAASSPAVFATTLGL